jgi:hypothetical protein
VVELPELNHMFQHAEKVVTLMTRWVAKHT